MGKNVKVLLVARYYIIEPLGLLHLIGLAVSLGCEVDVELIKNNNFTDLYRRVKEWKPDFVGFQIWTGWHLQTFVACDQVRTMGPQVIIGGPHVTYFTDECAKHADFIVRGDGFRNFRRILQGEVGPGVHFDTEQLAEKFPMPDRSITYGKYPVLRESPVRSMITSVGCPFSCSYCYAPEWNKMYGGFHHTQRSVDDIIREGLEIREHWGAQMIYLQDDIFGLDYRVWLPEFARRWKREIGIPFHCQIRLELTRHHAGDSRLNLFKEAGCTGVTLAIESGDAFLREHVLHRAMSDELILEGCAKIHSRGMTLRTEQILAVPFSNLETDLSTLDLNNRIRPEMAWTSILAPYGGTEMGNIAKTFGYYKGENDDLHELYFDRSVMRHSKTAKDVVESMIRKSNRTLQQLSAQETIPVIEFMTDDENDRHADQVVILQRLFMWFSLVPRGRDLAERFITLSTEEWTWKKLGLLAKEHFELINKRKEAEQWVQKLIKELGICSQDELPSVIRDNPYYFIFFPSSAKFARHIVESGAVDENSEPGRQFDKLVGVARRWLFARSLYKIESATRPIAS